MKSIIRATLIGLVAFTLAGCSADWEKLHAVYTLATTTTVPAADVRVAANSFDILKGTANNFAIFCVKNGFTPPGCDVDTRRKISTFVKQGTKARIQLRASIATNQPALSTVYNLLITAVTGLQATPAATFSGG